jgi:hypothetical protein
MLEASVLSTKTYHTWSIIKIDWLAGGALLRDVGDVLVIFLQSWPKVCKFS